jgi:hypothetical protein
LVLGVLVPARAFVFLRLCTFCTWRVWAGFSGPGALYDGIFAWIALQLGF